MAAVPAKAETMKLSFAKVVASGGKENSGGNTFAKAAASAPAKDTRRQTVAPIEAKDGILATETSETARPQEAMSRLSSVAKVAPVAGELAAIPTTTTDASATESGLLKAVQALNVNDTLPSLVVNGSVPSKAGNKGASDALSSENALQSADLGSELSTNPSSIDDKSYTSGTTFALDEKESLRPDDSASVKAADDDDTFSTRDSIIAGSRIGSQAATRAYRAQVIDVPDKQNIVVGSDVQDQEVIAPQISSSGQPVIDDGKEPASAMQSVGPEVFNLFYRQTPDEKLLEALESPKDRIFLLRLEQDVIEFVKDSKEPFVDLPPCNSFCRMLTHKLADYYHMTHQVDSVAGAVRIFRTPFCRLPPPLTSISNPPTSTNTPPPPIPAMKIMRRGGDGGTGPSPSKDASEAGIDGKDKLSAKEKMSREDREAAYNAARERIFGSSEKSSDATPENEDSNGMSRSSSVSTRDRQAQTKRGKSGKQRRDDLEGFDVRSQYTPYFAPQQLQPAWSPNPHYASVSAQQRLNGGMQPSYQGTPPTSYNTNPNQYGQMMMPNSSIPPYAPIPQQFTQQSPQQQPPPLQQFHPPHNAPIKAYGSPNNSPHHIQQYSQQNYPVPYQSRGPAPPVSAGVLIPYPYGQLPSALDPADPKSQHPIPGSFNRHAFNPQTQSFVPGGAGAGGQPPPQARSLHGSPHMQFNGFASPQHPQHAQHSHHPQPQQYGNGMGYNMARQGSNNNMVPQFQSSPHIGGRPMMHQGMATGGNAAGAPGSHLPSFGNVASLPPKPPPTA